MIKISNLNYKFKTGIFALSNINLEINKNEFVTVIGRNGSGKSTFSKILSGITKFKTGEIFIDNIDIKNKKNFLEIRKKVSIVFQNPETQIIFDTVYDDIAFSLKNLGYSANEINSRINFALKKVNMLEFKNSSTSELSLGQKQKIAIASAIANSPKVLILDEPTTGLDPKTRILVWDLISYLRKEKQLTVF